MKLIALSCNDVQEHHDWTKDIKCYGKLDVIPYPIIDDKDRKLATKLGMIDPAEISAEGLPLTARAVSDSSY